MTPNTDSVAVLRECPFCGSNPPIVAVYDMQHPIIWCRQCGAQTQPAVNAEKASASWNRRAPGGVGDAVTELCPACEREGAVQTLYTETVHLEAHLPVRVIGLEGLYCPHCGETTIAFDQAKRNDERFKVARAAALAARTGKGE